jgi:large subunit ribosomal protein L10
VREKDLLFYPRRNNMPSKTILEQKQQVVAELTDKIKKSVSGVVVNYQGITVEDDTKMRKAMREAGISYQVIKNSLTGRACDNCGYGDIKQYLSGMTAIAVSESDAVAPAKILKEYADKIESFKILAGYIDGGVIDAEGVERLAKIPNKETLIMQLLVCIRSPLVNFVYVLDQASKAGETPADAPEAPAEA